MTGLSRPVSALIAVVIFAAGLAVGWFGRGSFSGPADVPTIAIYDGWRLACPAASETDKSCVIANDLVDSKTQKTIAQLTVVQGKAGTVLIVTAPFDVFLPAGVGLALGNDKPRAYPYLTCSQSGCIARIPVDDALHTALMQGGQGKLLLGNLDHKTVSIVFSLNGFVRADQAMRARKNQHSFFGMAI